MTDLKKTKRIYIVLSQTGTIMSRLIKLYTREEYNHVSISLSADLRLFYSFGRRTPYNPFNSGFVEESPEFGLFRRFPNTKVAVLSITLDEEKYDAIASLIASMAENKEKYGYNHLGFWGAAVNLPMKSRDRYFCSEFIKYIFERFEIEGVEELGRLPHPIHFLNLSRAERVYTGTLSAYRELAQK